jgi:hypothetical protein
MFLLTLSVLGTNIFFSMIYYNIQPKNYKIKKDSIARVLLVRSLIREDLDANPRLGSGVKVIIIFNNQTFLCKNVFIYKNILHL